MIAASGVDGAPVIGIEATGSLHRAWASELERRWPGSLRLFAPSETTAARGQLGFRRLRPTTATARRWSGWFARAPAGRLSPTRSRRCAARSVIVASSWLRAARFSSACTTSSTCCAPGSQRRPGTAAHSSSRRRPARPCWRARRRSPDALRRRDRCGRAPPAVSRHRRRRSGSGAGSNCWRRHRTPNCAPSASAAICGAGSFSKPTLLATNATWPTCSRAPTGRSSPACRASPTSAPQRSAPSRCRSSAGPRPSTCTPRPAWRPRPISPVDHARRGRISRQGLPEHRDALMGIAWGLSPTQPRLPHPRRRTAAPAGCRPIQARVALARHACRLAWRLLHNQQPFDERRYARARQARAVTALLAMPHDGAT